MLLELSAIPAVTFDFEYEEINPCSIRKRRVEQHMLRGQYLVQEGRMKLELHEAAPNRTCIFVDCWSGNCKAYCRLLQPTQKVWSIFRTLPRKSRKQGAVESSDDVQISLPRVVAMLSLWLGYLPKSSRMVEVLQAAKGEKISNSDSNELLKLHRPFIYVEDSISDPLR